MLTEKKYYSQALEFWGGIECTINRIQDSYFDQMEMAGHYSRKGDIGRIAGLGIKTLRYPILWERHEPDAQETIDWTHTANRLNEMKQHRITPIAGLLHHGSGPEFTDLADNHFPEKFAAYAGKVARQFPWLEYFTPINEPLTTARFSGLYGLWYPHAMNDVSFAKMILNQVQAIILAMSEIRKINPAAKLIQTEDLSKTFSSPLIKYQATFENERRWLTYDLLLGKVKAGHPMWSYFLRLGIPEKRLHFFIDNATTPEVAGFNYYVTSERFLDEDKSKYPASSHGGNELQEYADVEAIRVNHGNAYGLKVLLKEAWERFRLPMAITESHLNAGREDQVRWLNEICKSCSSAIEEGINVRAVTFWSLFGAFGWSKLLTDEKMVYEPGTFDLRTQPARPTAISLFIKNIILKNNSLHPLAEQHGWWHDPARFHGARSNKETDEYKPPGKPLLIIGNYKNLGQNLANACKGRNIPFTFLKNSSVLGDERSLNKFLETRQPWAVMDFSGFETLLKAEVCGHEFSMEEINLSILLSATCKEKGIAYTLLSSSIVFDPRQKKNFRESDPISPTTVCGRTVAIAEEKIIGQNPSALIIRTGHLFDAFTRNDFCSSLISRLSANEYFECDNDSFASPCYLPSFVHCALELLVDEECGIWHLANDEVLSPFHFARKIALKAGFDLNRIRKTKNSENRYSIIRGGLGSMRGKLMPSLDESLDHFFSECRLGNDSTLFTVRQ